MKALSRIAVGVLLVQPRAIQTSLICLFLQFDHMGYAWIRICVREPDRPIKSVGNIGVATQADPRVVTACKSEHMLHQLPANSPPSFIAAYITAA